MEYCQEHQYSPKHARGENQGHMWLVDKIRSNPEIVGLANAKAYSRVYKSKPDRERFIAEVDNVIFCNDWINFVEVKTGKRAKTVPDGKRSLIRSGRIFIYEHDLPHLRLVLYRIMKNGLAQRCSANLTRRGLMLRKDGSYWRQETTYTPLDYFELQSKSAG
jgi:hypothetical protein